jgi:hypothetical protein
MLTLDVSELRVVVEMWLSRHSLASEKGILVTTLRKHLTSCLSSPHRSMSYVYIPFAFRLL